MDQLIQNGLSNLEIETPHPHSSSPSSQKEVDKEVKRNWVIELPADVMSLILLKLGVINILVSAQCVCTSWWKLSKQPHLFRSINVSVLDRNSKHSSVYSNAKLLREVVREAIGRSCGQLVEFSVGDIANDDLLHYMSEKSSSLQCLRLLNMELSVTDHGLIGIAKKFPHLEELKISMLWSYIPKDVIEAFGCFCPQLKSCSFSFMFHDVDGNKVNGVALAIAENMHELRHLHFGNSLRDADLRVILDGCPHLETLDLLGDQCFGPKFAGDLKERCRNIKMSNENNFFSRRG